MKNNEKLKTFCKELNITRKQFYGQEPLINEYFFPTNSFKAQMKPLRIDVDIPDGFSVKFGGVIIIGENVDIYGEFTPACCELIFEGNQDCLINCTIFKPITLENIDFINFTELPSNIGKVSWSSTFAAPKLIKLPDSFEIEDPECLDNINLASVQELTKKQFDNLFSSPKQQVVLCNLKKIPKGSKIVANDLDIKSITELCDVDIICNRLNHNLILAIKCEGVVNIAAGIIDTDWIDIEERDKISNLNIQFAFKISESGHLVSTKSNTHCTTIKDVIRLSDSIVELDGTKYLTTEDLLFKINSIRKLNDGTEVVYATSVCNLNYRDYYFLVEDDNLEDAHSSFIGFKHLMKERYGDIN